MKRRVNLIREKSNRLKDEGRSGDRNATDYSLNLDEN